MSDIPNINEKVEGDCGFVAGFGGTKVGVYASSLYQARVKADAHFKPSNKRRGELWVVLAERSDGSVVNQSTAI